MNGKIWKISTHHFLSQVMYMVSLLAKGLAKKAGKDEDEKDLGDATYIPATQRTMNPAK